MGNSWRSFCIYPHSVGEAEGEGGGKVYEQAEAETKQRQAEALWSQKKARLWCLRCVELELSCVYAHE